MDFPPYHLEISFVGEEFRQACVSLPYEERQRKDKHGGEGDAGADGRAHYAGIRNQDRAGKSLCDQSHHRTEGTIANLSTANKIVTDDAVASQGDDADRKTQDDPTHSFEFGIEQIIRINPFRNAGDTKHHQTHGTQGQLEQLQCDLALFFLLRRASDAAIFDITDTSADVPYTL